MNCMARCKTNILIQCKHKKKNNSEFCGRHTNYTGKKYNEDLFDTLTIEQFIKNYIQNNKLSKNNKFSKNDILIIKYILQKYNYKFNNELKKKNIILYFNEFINYYNNIKKIILIQSIIRKKYILYINRLKNISFKKKSFTNTSDFYTFEEKVSYHYFFSFYQNNYLYFFDIRSFKMLIENSTKNILNPYTCEPIHSNVIYNYNLLIKYLQNQNIILDFKEEHLSEEQVFNQKIITIFQIIDSFGYNTSIEWFKNLSYFSLKQFWSKLEDIWNFRCNLSLEQKNNIIQHNKPQPFTKFKYIHKITTKKYLQEIILDDIKIFLTGGIDKSYCNIGCLYVLTALSGVSKNCLQSMPWLNQI